MHAFPFFPLVYRRLFLALIVVAIVPAVAQPATAQTCGSCAAVRPQDQIWLLSTRCLGCPTEGDASESLQYRLYDPERGWFSSEAEVFYDPSDVPARTIFWIHGNQVDSATAQSLGMTAYRRVVGPESEPVRWVIWSWPSEKQYRGPIQDARMKAARSDVEALYLADVLGRLDTEQSVSLIGWSFGAGVATGSLHLLGGGRLLGARLEPDSPRPDHAYRVVLFGAAMDNDWLQPGRYHGRAMSQVDRMLVLYNNCDPVLQRYRLVSPCGNQMALGYWGFCSLSSLGEDASRVEEIDVCCTVGREHNSLNYFCSSYVAGLMRDLALEEPVP